MPFTSEEISEAGMIGLDFYMKNNPIDQIKQDRPFLAKMMAGKKPFPGAKQYVVEQIRTQYQSNFQWFNGSSTVTYNKRKTVKQANFPWRSAHDGFALDEDRLAQNGITIIEGKTRTATDAESIQLTNLLEEQTEVLREGFEEQFNQELLKDGSSDADALEGLDKLVTTAPGTTDVVGGIDAGATGNSYWQNGAATGITTTTTTGDILTKMEAGWRGCIRNGGKPDCITMGSTAVDGLRDFMLNTYGRVNWGHMDQKTVEAGSGHDQGTNTGMTFHGVPIHWDPTFADLGGTWEKRIYFLNSKHIKLRPLSGHDMITRKPPRAYDRYQYYWGLTWRGALTTNRRNAHWVGELA